MFIRFPSASASVTNSLPKSLRVVECPEFRALLLLLRSSLKDSMIPRRSKTSELLLVAWQREFQRLSRELAASTALRSSLAFSLVNISSRMLRVKSLLRQTYGLVKIADLFSRSLPTGFPGKEMGLYISEQPSSRSNSFKVVTMVYRWRIQWWVFWIGLESRGR